MTEIMTKACEIIERSPVLPTVDECDMEIENGRRIYDSLYSDYTQRKRAEETMKVYECIKGMLQRASHG